MTNTTDRAAILADTLNTFRKTHDDLGALLAAAMTGDGSGYVVRASRGLYMMATERADAWAPRGLQHAKLFTQAGAQALAGRLSPNGNGDHAQAVEWRAALRTERANLADMIAQLEGLAAQ